MKQLSFQLKPRRGGARFKAGRKPNGAEPGVPHLLRPTVSGREPVHVTMRVVPGLGYLRKWSRRRAILQCFLAARDRLGMRIAHYSIQGAHLHLIVEPESRDGLFMGMQALGVRLARALNRAAGRTGRVFADRYHSHVLRTRREVANTLRYVLHNIEHHSREPLPRGYVDPCSSAAFLERAPADAPVASPRTWLLRVGWRAAEVSAPASRRRPPRRPARRASAQAHFDH